MSYTLRGRLESRLAAALAPLLAAGILAGALRAWWPLELAALMIGVGVALDAAVLHRLLPYQPGWVALPLGLVELAAVMGLARVLGVAAPLAAALAFYGGSWLLAQLLGHAVFPLASLTYGEDGGELGRAGPVLAGAVLAALAFSGGVAWGGQPPTVRLSAGVHDGPLVLDRAQKLVGDGGTIVRGGIVVTADDVTVRGVTVIGGEHGIEVDGAEGVVLRDVTVLDARRDGINVRESSVRISDCVVRPRRGEYAQGIDISFSSQLPPSVVERCTVIGGREGIVSHMAHLDVRENDVRGTTLRGIAMTEMSMGAVEENEVRDALGVGIFCGDYSSCEIAGNDVTNTRRDDVSGDRTRLGYGIVAHYGANATLRDNQLIENASDVAAFVNATIAYD